MLRSRVSLLSKAMRKNGMIRARRILNDLKPASPKHVIFFSDENFISVDQNHNLIHYQYLVQKVGVGSGDAPTHVRYNQDLCGCNT